VKPQKLTLIVIQGMPGAGKTTLARQLAKSLKLPQLGKDELKEFFFDKLGIGDRDWSRDIGRVASETLYEVADAMLANNRSFILESAFYKQLAVAELARVLKANNARCLELYCYTNQDERHRRFVARNESGERHPGHIDAANYNASSEAQDADRYAPLEIGDMWKIDTTHFGETEYNELRQKLELYLKEGNL